MISEENSHAIINTNEYDEGLVTHSTQTGSIRVCGKKFNITKSQLIAIILLSLFFFLTSSFYSIFAPFYPLEASKKGMNQTQIGIIFGIFQFTLLVLSPVFGKYVIKIAYI